ncbi:MAG: dihydroxyacetone kinase subunit DhaL [Deltaproteobacteria bacterium]|nr:dihydroxyacetone kinase subunit DhaL [Deltaproteobacteria bacterium]
MEQFANRDGIRIVFDLIRAIQENKQYLSDIDGAIGDGDHGINMNKGFTLCRDELLANPGNLTHGLKTLSKILVMKIGGSMGPLYGTFFKSLAAACDGVDAIDMAVFGRMLSSGREGLQKISDAKPGDKTLMDVLLPAEAAYQAVAQTGEPFRVCLDQMVEAARQGRDATKDMVAKLGRSSRLGERSRGVIDAGAASCCLILEIMAGTIGHLLTCGSEARS